MISISIKIDQLLLLDSLHLNLNHYWLLASLYYNSVKEDWILAPSNISQTLIRKDLCTEDMIITSEGKLLYEKVRDLIKFEGSKEVKKELKAIRAGYSKEFEEWWETYPPGDSWIDSTTNKEWIGSRAFKVRKDECAKKYKEALLTRTSEELLNALLYEIELKQSQSRRSGLNKLAYMQNTLTYLNQKAYEGYVSMYKLTNWKPQKINSENEGNLDIMPS